MPSEPEKINPDESEASETSGNTDPKESPAINSQAARDNRVPSDNQSQWWSLNSINSRHEEEDRLEEMEDESMAEGLPAGINIETTNSDLIPEHRHLQKCQIYRIYLHLITGSLFGVIARKGLESLTSFSGSYLSGVVWANFAACFVMGLAVESAVLWANLIDEEERGNRFVSKAEIPFYVGVTTGFCGSCSSFSTFILEAIERAANISPILSYPNAAYGILGALEVICAQICISICGFRFGVHTCRGLERKNYSLGTSIYYFLETASIIIGILGYIAVVVLVATKKATSWRSWTFSCLFAPWGSFLRFSVSKALNRKIQEFPIGTWLCNVSGTIILAILTLLSAGRSTYGTSSPIVAKVLNCQVIVGLADGFCGCFTTVSTFVVELSVLRHFHGYIYCSVSVVTSFVAMLLIIGSYNWTVGFTSKVC